MEGNVKPAVSRQLSPPSPSEWLYIWKEAIVKPQVRTYRWIARRADIKTAYTWLALGWPSLIVVILVLRLLLGTLSFGPYLIDNIFLSGIVIVTFSLIQIALISLSAALTNLVAKALGGSGNYCELIYCIAAYFVPIFTVYGTLSFLSQTFTGLSAVFSLLDAALTIYIAVLNVNAVRAVHYIKTWKAVLANSVLFVLAVLVAILVTVLAPLLGLTS